MEDYEFVTDGPQVGDQVDFKVDVEGEGIVVAILDFGGYPMYVVGPLYKRAGDDWHGEASYQGYTWEGENVATVFCDENHISRRKHMDRDLLEKALRMLVGAGLRAKRNERRLYWYGKHVGLLDLLCEAGYTSAARYASRLSDETFITNESEEQMSRHVDRIVGLVLEDLSRKEA